MINIVNIMPQIKKTFERKQNVFVGMSIFCHILFFMQQRLLKQR
jgi:hypothetical protein